MSPRIAPLLLACLLSLTATGRPAEPTRTDAYGDPLPPGALLRLGTVRWRAFARFLAFTPDGKTLVTGEGLGQQGSAFRRWEAATGAELASFRPDGLVSCCALSPDGKELALDRGADPESIVFVRLSNGKELRRTADLPVHLRLTQLRYSPDGRLLAGVASDGDVHIWHAAEGRELPFGLKGAIALGPLAFSPDGKTLAVASGYDRLRLLDVASGRERWTCDLDKNYNEELATVAFSPDGKTLLWRGEGYRSLALWDVETGERRRSFRAARGTVRPVALSPDGRWIASVDKIGDAPACFGLWDAATGEEVRRLVGPADNVAGEPTFSPDGKRLAASAGNDGTAHVWDVATGQDVAVLGEHTGVLRAVGFTPDGREALTGGMDGTVRTWDATTGVMRRRIEVGVAADPGRWDGWDVAFSPDRRAAVVSAGVICPGSDATVWDLTRGVRRASLSGRRCPAGRAPFTPDGSSLATFDDERRGVQLWDARTGKPTWFAALGRSGCEADVAFAPDGRMLVAQQSLMESGWELTLWDPGLRKFISQPPTRPGERTYAFHFSPDGRTVARGKSREVELWDVAADRTPATLRLPTDAPATETLCCLAWSRDGRMLAAGASVGDVYIWELITGQARRRLKGHRNGVACLDFSPDGRCLISGSADTTALIWDLTGLEDDKEPKNLPPERLPALWDELAGADAAKAWRAVWRLAADPEASVPFLSKRLRPAAVDVGAVAKALAALDSDDFDEREAATRRLATWGDLAAPALRAALAADPSPEARRRLEELVGRLGGPVQNPDETRALRCVEVLEHIGSAEARRLLDDLAKGAPGAALTGDAKAALARLDKTPSRRDDGGQ